VPYGIAAIKNLARVVLAANPLFSINLISCLHLCFANINFPSQFSNKRHFFCVTFAHLLSFHFHDCKHENLVFRSRIEIITWNVMIFLVNMPIMLTSYLFLCNW
jgi:hypothetical protein